MGEYVRRRSAVGGAERAGVPEDPAFLKAHPALFDNMTALTYPDGAARQPLTLSIFADGAAWKACLRDKDAGAVAFASGKTLQGLLGALERGLAEDRLDWRPDTWSKAGKKGRG